MSSKLSSDVCYLARVAPSAEFLGLVWLIGEVCMLAAVAGPAVH